MIVREAPESVPVASQSEHVSVPAQPEAVSVPSRPEAVSVRIEPESVSVLAQPDALPGPSQPEPVPIPVPIPPPPRVKREYAVAIDGKLYAEDPRENLINLVTPEKPTRGLDDSFSTFATFRVENEGKSTGLILIDFSLSKSYLKSKIFG